MKERPILMTPENAQKCFDGSKTQTRRIIKPHPKVVHAWNGEWLATNQIFRNNAPGLRCPYGQVGDRLWIREAFTYWEYSEAEHKPKNRRVKHVRWEDLTIEQQKEIIERLSHEGEDYLVYKGGGAKRSLSEWKFPHPIYDHCIGRFGKTIPSIHMHRWACRTVVEITEIRVQRVQEISEADAIAEGVEAIAKTTDRSRQFYKSYLLSGDGTFCEQTARDSFMTLWESINGPGSWEENPFVWALTFKKV